MSRGFASRGITVSLILLGWLGVQAWATQDPANPSESQQAYRQGMTYVHAGRLDEAIQEFQKGLRSDGHNLVLLNAIGAAYSLKGETARARDYYLKDLQIDPSFTPARKNLAVNYFEAGEYELAAPHFEKLIDDPATGPFARLFLGIIAEKRANYSKSALLLGKAGELVWQYPQAVLSYAHALYELKQFGKGEAILDHLDTVPRVQAEDHFQAGLLYEQHGQYRKAIEELNRASQIAPQLPRLQYQRAVVLDKLGRSEEAMKILQNPVSQKPDADSLNLLAHIAEKNGDLGLAIQSLRQAAKLAPWREDNYLDFTTLCLDYENFPLALEAVDVGLAHIPNSYRLMVEKGVILDKQGRHDKAEEVLRQASKLQKDNSVALLSLAIVQTHAGHLQDALDTLSPTIKRFPGNYYMQYYLGNILVQMNERQPLSAEMTAKAEKALREAIRLNPSFGDSYYQLARLYLHKNPTLAEENLLACLRVDPQHATAKYELGRLYLRTGKQGIGQKLIDEFVAQQKAEKLKEQRRPRIESSPTAESVVRKGEPQ